MRLTEAQRAFLDRPLHAVVATLRRDGTAVQSVVWYARDGDELWLSVAPGSVKVAHLRRDPRVAVLVLGADGGTYLALEGTATVAGEAGALAFVAQNPLPRPNARVRIRPTRAVEYNLPA
jgi:PPOX class probable F420-dependent enzyme